jgi:hypothetical protein
MEVTEMIGPHLTELRDEIAIMVLRELIRHRLADEFTTIEPVDWRPLAIKSSWDMADAMLAGRDK